MQYGIKEAARHFTAPTVGSFNAAVRLSRYLLGTRDYVMKLEPNDKQQLVVYTDSERDTSFDKWNSRLVCRLRCAEFVEDTGHSSKEQRRGRVLRHWLGSDRGRLVQRAFSPTSAFA